MANWIPKITYTELGTGSAKTVTFESPPEGDPFNEEISAIAKTNQSTDGSTQTQWNYNKQVYNVQFTFQSETVKDDFEDFLKAHAYRGGVFEYFPHTDEVDSDTYTLMTQSVKFERPIPDGSGDFEYNFSFKIEQVLDFEYETEGVGVGAINETQFTIVNNQSSVANVTGLAFSISTVRGARIDYTINRTHTTPNSEVSQYGNMLLVYNTTGTSWELTNDSVGDAGVTFTITAAGQIQYTSTNIPGTPDVSAMRFRASTISMED